MSTISLPLPVTANTIQERRSTRAAWRFIPQSRTVGSPPQPQSLGDTIVSPQSQPSAGTTVGLWDRENALSLPASSTSTLGQSLAGDAETDIEKGAQDLCPCPLSWPQLPEPTNSARRLTRTELRVQRGIFILFVLLVNLGLAAVTLFGNVGFSTLVFVVFFKAQDTVSTLVSIVCVVWTTVAGLFRTPEPVSRRCILSLMPDYNESEEQMLKCICQLQENVCEPHKQVVAIVLDGRPKNLKGEFSRIVADFERPYHSLKHKAGTLKITAGFFNDDLPVIMIEKVQNSGKKDSLALTHDLFNCPRDNMPVYTRLLREEIWASVLPTLTAGTDFSSFDMVFCTDADSVIHDGCMMKLADQLARDQNAIAACGLVLVEFEPGYEWSVWNFFQLLQYAYGQFVRRWAEGFVGKVTCLPGCVTMIAVRAEMAGAIAKFARPVTEDWVLHHQVQNLGTDRRLTYCMLSQSATLRTLFVPDAVSETVAPQSLKHYLHQRRRWGSNAYFNFFYCGGVRMMAYTRLVALLHVTRQTCVYYHILNTVLFIRALVLHGSIRDVLPLLVLGQFPVLWFCVCMLQPCLLMRIHKLLLGFLINKIVSPFLSCMVFAAVATNLGNAVWGMSGITASSAQAASTQTPSSTSSEKESIPFPSNSLSSSSRKSSS